jgi:hypothetical protein
MLRRRGNYKEGANPTAMAAAFEKHLREVYAWLDGKLYVKSIRLAYHDALEHPAEVSRKLADFLGTSLNVEAMTKQVGRVALSQPNGGPQGLKPACSFIFQRCG